MSADELPVSNPGASHPSLREIKAAGGRWGLDEFVAVVNGLVERYLPASRSFNVKLRAAFNPRLVRYYATFGLISPPEREGKEARYRYGHLLQALVIRRLLFEGYTAPVLLKMLAGKTEADYEAMLAGGVSVAAAPAPRQEVAEHAAAAGPPEALRLVRDLMAVVPPRPAAAAAPVVRAETLLWRRVEVAPGLELHVRADFDVPDTRTKRESLLLAMLEGLQPGEPSLPVVFACLLAAAPFCWGRAAGPFAAVPGSVPACCQTLFPMPSDDFPRPDPNTYWVLPGRFLAGEYPGAASEAEARAKIAAFLKAGITTFIDLTEAHELDPYEPLLPAVGIEYRRMSIRDAGVPHARSHMTDILDAIDGALARGRSVYLHCWGGIGRTGTVAACWLRRHGRTGEEALAELADFWQTVGKRHRAPNTPETPGQVAWVHGWEEEKPAA